MTIGIGPSGAFLHNIGIGIGINWHRSRAVETHHYKGLVYLITALTFIVQIFHCFIYVN